jgi:hypothetical protein
MTDSTVSDRVVTPAEGFTSLYGLWLSRPELSGFHDGGGAGDVVTTAADMGRWLVSQTGNGTRLGTPASLETMHTRSDVHDYGMGWAEEVVDGTKLLVHSGNLFTYSAVAGFAPDTGYGFAVMTNSAALHDDTFAVLSGLVALSGGRSPEMPGGERQRVDLVLGLVALAAVGSGVWGVLRARRWASRRVAEPSPTAAARPRPRSARRGPGRTGRAPAGRRG